MPAPDDLPIGDRYQQTTKYHRSHGKGPGPGKAEPTSRAIELPAPQAKGGDGLWGVIEARRSVRDFNADALTLDQLSQRDNLRFLQQMCELAAEWLAAHPAGAVSHHGLDIPVHTNELLRQQGRRKEWIRHAAHLDQGIVEPSSHADSEEMPE